MRLHPGGEVYVISANFNWVFWVVYIPLVAFASGWRECTIDGD